MVDTVFGDTLYLIEVKKYNIILPRLVTPVNPLIPRFLPSTALSDPYMKKTPQTISKQRLVLILTDIPQIKTSIYPDTPSIPAYLALVST